MTYSEKLKDPRWQMKRLVILQRAECICEECGEQKHLHVHHLYYQTGFNPWDYPDKALKALCSKCHEIRAEAERNLALALRLFSSADLTMIAESVDQISAIDPECAGMVLGALLTTKKDLIEHEHQSDVASLG